MNKNNTFCARVFLAAGIYGLAALLPQYFLEGKVGRDHPPLLTHPEYFYGFIGVAVAWQFVFLMIAFDVRRYRLLMLPAILEKLSFGVAAWVLYVKGRVDSMMVFFASIDLLLGILFALAFHASRDVGIVSRDERKGHEGRNGIATDTVLRG